MQTTFLNGDEELKQRGLQSLNSRAEDFKNFIKFGFSLDDVSEEDDNFQEAKKFFENEAGSFFDYGLDFSFIEAGTFDDQKEGFYRYQLSYGGPSDEIRFYHDKRIEFVFLDWLTGVGFDVTNEDWAKWILQTFEELQSIDWDSIPYEEKVLTE